MIKTGLRYVLNMQNHRQIGGKLGAYIRASNPSTQQIQAFLGDLLAGDELLLPMKDVVARPGFTVLAAMAGTGGGAVQRDALLQELSRSYLPSVVEGIGVLISGLLDLPDRQARGESALPEEAAGRQPIEREKVQPASPGKQPEKKQRKVWSPFVEDTKQESLPDFMPQDYGKRDAYLVRRARSNPGNVAGLFLWLAILAAPWFGIRHRSWALAIWPLASAIAVGFGIDFIAIAAGAEDGLGIVSTIAGAVCGAYISNGIAKRNRRQARELLLARRN